MRYMVRLASPKLKPFTLSALPRTEPRPLRCRCGPAIRQTFLPSAAEAMCRRLGATHTAGCPSTTVPCGDAYASMPAPPTAAPLTLRATSRSFLSTHTKHEKRSGAVSEGPARHGPTSPRSRCPAPGPPAPATRASPGKVNIFGQSGRWEKKRGEKRSGLAALALKELRKLDFYI